MNLGKRNLNRETEEVKTCSTKGGAGQARRRDELGDHFVQPEEQGQP